ncbi:uncharacterized protein [Dysidea avara]
MLFILLLALIEVSSSQAVQVIQVDPVNGVYNLTCWTGSVPCGSLNYALGGVTNNNTRLQLASGSFNLSTLNATMIGLSSITIEGAGVLKTVVTCNYSDAGLYFVEVDHLTIANLTISNCGMLQNSTTWNTSSPAKYRSAVTVYNTSNVVVDSVMFYQNNGIGLSIVNTGGVVTISNSVFDSNYVSGDGEYPGGGGLYIEFPFCLPDSFSHAVLSSNSRNSHSQYTVDTCYFTNNIAKKMTRHTHTSDVTLLPCAKETFGRGGGMSIFIRGYATNNTITITNTVFTSNLAKWGAGLLIEFNHYSNNNTVSVKERSRFTDNHCVDSSNHSNSGGGGGAQIVYSSYENTNSPGNNKVFFSQCDFTGNTAYWGGGLSYLIVKEPQQLATNILYFDNCNWQNNVARFGAAVDLSLYQSLASGVVLPVVFENCSFVGNSLSMPVGQFELQGIGTLYTNFIVVTFKGSVVFNANEGSALVISAAGVNISDNCVLTFANNKGRRGAAVSLLASSWINVRDNTAVTFSGNKADAMGGAIYAELINEHNMIATWNCFFQYFNATIEPDMWTTKIRFQQNVAQHGGHSIYATTLRSCLWGKSYTLVTQDDIKSVFHWKSFEFDGMLGTKPFAREMEIATDANFLSTNETDLRISPGETYHLPFNQSDDKGQQAKTVFFIQSNDEETGKVGNRSVYVYSDIMQVYGKLNSTFNITVTSLGHVASTVILNITFDFCPPGYVSFLDKVQNATSCKCATEVSGGYPGILGCDDEIYQARISRYHWGGIHKRTNKFVTANCPQGSCTFEKSKYAVLLPNSRSQLDESQCQSQNRIGTICGECMDGYSMSSGSNCIKCDHGTTIGILFFVLYECLPTLVFVSIILFFNINITSGHWNSLIFYFQILETLDLYALRRTNEFSKPIEILIKIHTTFFGIWNLNFFQDFLPEQCYIKGLKNVFGLYLLKYVTVLFALGLIVVLAIAKNYNCFNFTCFCTNQNGVHHQRINQEAIPLLEASVNQDEPRYKKIWKKVWNSSNASFIHGFATVIVLSYTKVALISMKFIIPSSLYGSRAEVVDIRVHHVGTMRYLRGDHLWYAIPSFFLVVASVIFPLYLTVKPFWGKLFPDDGNGGYFKKCQDAMCCYIRQDKIDQLLLEFYGSFKDNRRYYAGFFFFYRLILYAMLAFTTSLTFQYSFQQGILGFFLLIHSIFQPYGELFSSANILDALIFFNLSVINAISMYNYYSVVDIQGESQFAVILQLIFIYLPLIYVLYRFIHWLKKIHSDDPQENGHHQNGRQRNQPQLNENQPNEADHESVDLEEDRERDRQQYLESINMLNDYYVVNPDQD